MFKTLRGPLAMRRAVARGAVLLALVLALSGCGSNHSTVPSQVRDAIVKDDPGLAFIPGRLPSGYHYASWNNCRNRSCYVLAFVHGSGKHPVYLDLYVQRRSCPAPPKWPAKDTHTLHVDGHALKWLQSDEGPIVWRCMTSQGRSIVLSGVSMNGPRQKVAELVDYTEPAH